MSLVLHNLLRVPSITINFIRVSRFSRDNNVYFQFNANESLVKSQETGDILLQGCVRYYYVYEFPFISTNTPKSIT